MSGSVWPALTAGAKAKASEVESKFDWIELDIVPMIGGTKTDATYDLGTSSFRWRDVWVSRNIVPANGTAASPALKQSSAQTGIYFPTTNEVGISIAGSLSSHFMSNSAFFPDGTTTAAGIGFESDRDTGFIRVGANNMAMIASGASVLVTTKDGEITKPLQPMFLAFVNSLTNIAVATNIPFTTEHSDVNDDYTTTGIFTAPVTGKYHFDVSLYVDPSPTSATSIQVNLIVAGVSWESFSFKQGNTATAVGLHHNITIRMTAGDTARVQVNHNGTGVVSINGNAATGYSWFSGFLVS